MFAFKTIRSILWLITVACLLSTCKTAPKIGQPLSQDALIDGVYEGYYKTGLNAASVEVTIENRQIKRIKILNHDAWKGKKAEPVIVKRIIEQQSTNVDAVSGATNSSHVIMNAVQKAVEKAFRDNS